jgi:hypothetical protein
MAGIGPSARGPASQGPRIDEAYEIEERPKGLVIIQ